MWYVVYIYRRGKHKKIKYKISNRYQNVKTFVVEKKKDKVSNMHEMLRRGRVSTGAQHL